MGRKTFVFAVHALAYEKLEEYVEKGRMPNLEQLMENGCHGVSRSVFSTASAVDYVSMLTGCTPLSHGIDDFQTNTVKGSIFGNDPSEQGVKTVPPSEAEDTRLYTSRDVKKPWIWDIMKKHRAVQLGVFSPATYPAPELPNDGIWVSGYWNDPMLLKDNPEASNSQEARKTILYHYEDYQLTPYMTVPAAYPDYAENELEYLDRKLEADIDLSNKTQRARLELMKNEDWDVFLTEEFFCDNIQHVLWPRSEDNPNRSETDEVLAERDLLGRFYEHVDALLGMYMEELPDDANIIVISAHGQEETEIDTDMHGQFSKLFEYGIWKGPEGWSFRKDKPEWCPKTRAEHTFDGAYIVSGPDFGSSGESAPISCMDFTPLLLELYGYEVPLHIDGKIPKHILEDRG